jgi:acetoin utilization protein AcuB
MFAHNMINYEVPPLRTSDSGLKAITFMEEFKLSHFPIVNNLDFLGMITEEDVYSLNSPEEALGNHKLSLQKPYVKEDDHLMEVIRVMHGQRLTAVAVIDEQGRYKGLITRYEIVQYLAEMTAVQQPGALIVIEVNDRDYQLSQISAIVESNDCKILSVSLKSIPDSTKIEVWLKLNRIDIGAVIATFTRFSYSIKASYFAHDEEDIDKRYDLLMKFLDM